MFCASEKIQDDGEIVEKIDHFHFNNLGLLFWKDFSFLFICQSQISTFVIESVLQYTILKKKTIKCLMFCIIWLTLNEPKVNAYNRSQ